FYTAQSLGFRHSHLDSGGYSYDQKHDKKDVRKAVDFLIADEQDRALLTSMVACLFARKVYTPTHLAECLNSLGYTAIADNLETIKQQIQQKRWQLRLASGYQPEAVVIPRRFTELTNWKGKTDGDYLKALKNAYAQYIKIIGARA
ncbi:MAG: aldehyde ferredoxin oxidoreductase, partial [Deltaproteobacteria bacterium]|nr:aldehyde ferredoxin oxidoreductase [Deltaproteobacteria bacterium]